MSNESDSSAQTWAAFTHLAGLAGLVIPFGNLLGPLILWLLKRAESPLVDDQGREALNFQISITLYVVIAALLVYLVIGAVLLPLVVLFWVIWTVIGAVRASDGIRYRYPLTLRLIK